MVAICVQHGAPMRLTQNRPHTSQSEGTGKPRDCQFTEMGKPGHACPPYENSFRQAGLPGPCQMSPANFRSACFFLSALPARPLDSLVPLRGTRSLGVLSRSTFLATPSLSRGLSKSFLLHADRCKFRPTPLAMHHPVGVPVDRSTHSLLLRPTGWLTKSNSCQDDIDIIICSRYLRDGTLATIRETGMKS